MKNLKTTIVNFERISILPAIPLSNVKAKCSENSEFRVNARVVLPQNSQ